MRSFVDYPPAHFADEPEWHRWRSERPPDNFLPRPSQWLLPRQNSRDASTNSAGSHHRICCGRRFSALHKTPRTTLPAAVSAFCCERLQAFDHERHCGDGKHSPVGLGLPDACFRSPTLASPRPREAARRPVWPIGAVWARFDRPHLDADRPRCDRRFDALLGQWSRMPELPSRGRNPALRPASRRSVGCFPDLIGRENEVRTLEERINGCMERSMNGRFLPEGGPEMKALLAYIRYISQGLPVGEPAPGRGIPALLLPEKASNPQRGAEVFQTQCAICHQPDGDGKR